MSTNFQQEVLTSYNRVLALSGQVEEMIDHAVEALINRQLELADRVIAMDAVVDQEEVKIEEQCLTMLARHQPVAKDLRRLTTIMKLNNDLERIADLACNVAERARDLTQYPTFPLPHLLSTMASEASSMVRCSLEAFIESDEAQAQAVIEKDDQLDEMNVQVIHELTELISQDPLCVEPGLFAFSASRSVEQIADHAVNMAEDIIYMVKGVIVRHRHGDFPLRSTR